MQATRRWMALPACISPLLARVMLPVVLNARRLLPGSVMRLAAPSEQCKGRAPVRNRCCGAYTWFAYKLLFATVAVVFRQYFVVSRGHWR